jgi:hypothetical protein
MSYGAWKMMLKGVIQMAQELNGVSTSNIETSPPDSPSFSVEAPSSPSNTEQEDNEVYYKDPYPKSSYTHSLELVKRAFDM